MRKITMDEIQELCKYCVGQINHIYLHWTAGHYDQTFSDYHINITGDGTMWTDMDNFTDHKSHTYMRNTGAIGIGLCCAYGAVSEDDLGDEPPTEAQLNVMAQLVAVLCIDLGIPLDIYHVMTHAEAADNMDGWDVCEKYGFQGTCERWDLSCLRQGGARMSGGDEMRGNARWYAHQWGSEI